jgi:hypothetical protein
MLDEVLHGRDGVMAFATTSVLSLNELGPLLSLPLLRLPAPVVSSTLNLRVKYDPTRTVY